MIKYFNIIIMIINFRLYKYIHEEKFCTIKIKKKYIPFNFITERNELNLCILLLNYLFIKPNTIILPLN